MCLVLLIMPGTSINFSLETHRFQCWEMSLSFALLVSSPSFGLLSPSVAQWSDGRPLRLVFSSSLSSFLPSLCLLAVFSGILFHLFFLTLLLRWVVTSSVIISDSFCCCCLEYSLIAGCRGLWDISPFRLLSLKISCCFHGDSGGNRDKWMCLICLFVFFYNLLIYFSVLGLCCCVSCSLKLCWVGTTLVAAHRLLIAVASLVEHRLSGMQALVVAAIGL